MDHRYRALNFLENSVKGAFAKGLKATIGAFDYVFLERGQEVQVGDHIMQTTDAGIFQKTPVESVNPLTKKCEFSHHLLLHYGHTDQLKGILNHLCRDMSVHEIELTMVGVAGHSVLTDMSRKRRTQTEDMLSI